MKQNVANWIVIHMAHEEQSAQKVCELLTREGFLVQYRSLASSTGEPLFEVCALSSEAKEARSVLIEMGY